MRKAALEEFDKIKEPEQQPEAEAKKDVNIIQHESGSPKIRANYYVDAEYENRGYVEVESETDINYQFFQNLECDKYDYNNGALVCTIDGSRIEISEVEIGVQEQFFCYGSSEYEQSCQDLRCLSEPEKEGCYVY